MNDDILKIIIKNCVSYAKKDEPTKVYYFFDMSKSNIRIMKLNQILESDELFNKPDITSFNLQYVVDYYTNTISTLINKRNFENWQKYYFREMNYYNYYFWSVDKFNPINLDGIEKIKNACDIQRKKEEEIEKWKIKSQLSYKQQQDRKYY